MYFLKNDFENKILSIDLQTKTKTFKIEIKMC